LIAFIFLKSLKTNSGNFFDSFLSKLNIANAFSFFA